MKIIELYGYSCSGKSFLANKIKSKENINDLFFKISTRKRFFRFFTKLLFIFSLKFTDFIFIFNIHKQFKFLNLSYKYKNFFSFLYLIGFIRKNIKKKKSVIIDHGIFQCLFSCYIFSKNSNINEKKISLILNNYFLKFPINFDYCIICMQTEINTIKNRLKFTKNLPNLYFLENNERKITQTYLNLQKVSELINIKSLEFKTIRN